MPKNIPFKFYFSDGSGRDTYIYRDPTPLQGKKFGIDPVLLGSQKMKFFNKELKTAPHPSHQGVHPGADFYNVQPDKGFTNGDHEKSFIPGYAGHIPEVYELYGKSTTGLQDEQSDLESSLHRKKTRTTVKDPFAERHEGKEDQFLSSGAKPRSDMEIPSENDRRRKLLTLKAGPKKLKTDSKPDTRYISGYAGHMPRFEPQK